MRALARYFEVGRARPLRIGAAHYSFHASTDARPAVQGPAARHALYFPGRDFGAFATMSPPPAHVPSGSARFAAQADASRHAGNISIGIHAARQHLAPRQQAFSRVAHRPLHSHISINTFSASYFRAAPTSRMTRNTPLPAMHTMMS